MMTAVKQQRVYELNNHNHQPFIDYLESHGYTEKTRAFICSVGQGMFSSIPNNSEFSRLTIPYKKAKNGYGTIIIPSSQIIASNLSDRVDKLTLYDVDLGSAYEKLSVKYVDMNGVSCESKESTRYIERYLNFSDSAYQEGFMCNYSHYGNRLSLDAELDDVCYLSSRNFQHVSHYLESFVDNGQFNYDRFRQRVQSSCDAYVDKALENPMDYIIDAVGGIDVGLTKTNGLIYCRSFVRGEMDKTKLKLMDTVYAKYPPDEHNKEYSMYKHRHDEVNNISHNRYLFDTETRSANNTDNCITLSDEANLDMELPFL